MIDRVITLPCLTFPYLTPLVEYGSMLDGIMGTAILDGNDRKLPVITKDFDKFLYPAVAVVLR